MRCLVCGKRIGPFRRLIDQKYCCDRHRKTAQKLSARAVRDSQDYGDLEEPWLITTGLDDETKRKTGTGFGPATGILLVVLVIFVALLAPPGQNRPRPARPGAPKLPLLGKIQKLLPGAPTFDFREDFSQGVSGWINETRSVAGGWTREAGKIRIGELRLWKPTLSMANYQFMFQGQIESKAMGWTFRASNADNYYATKLTVHGAGAAARTEIIRYVVVDGESSGRVRLPLPIYLEPHVPYKIRVRVKDDEFVTSVNGQVVDTWVDARHEKGGVGFFSDPGEKALLSWVRVNDANGIFSRLLSLSLFIGPDQMMHGPGR